MSKEMFVQVSDYKLYAKLLSETTGKPTIIMDAGYGDYSKAWDSVIEDISKLGSVLIYDRAGLGKSERSSNPRTSREMVKELKELLVKANIGPPYLLVGHSFGGVNMRIFATEYQNDVCGLVWLTLHLKTIEKDSSQRCPKSFKEHTTSNSFMKATMMNLWKV